jgi:O-antigen/teichoic acid export membrane protein
MAILIELVAGLAIAFWTYGDAKERKLNDAAAWGIVGFLFGLLGLAIYWYMVIRPNKRDTQIR